MLVHGFCKFGRNTLGVIALAASALATSGCSHAPPPPSSGSPPGPAPCDAAAPPLKVTLQASPLINPGEKREALSVVVRFYQLKGAGGFQTATFDELVDKPKEVLGEDLVQVTEVTLNPNDSLEPPIARKPDASFLGAVALFRRPGGQGWRAVQKFPDPDPNPCAAAGRQKPARPLTSLMRFFVDENRIELR